MLDVVTELSQDSLGTLPPCERSVPPVLRVRLPLLPACEFEWLTGVEGFGGIGKVLIWN